MRSHSPSVLHLGFFCIPSKFSYLSQNVSQYLKQISETNIWNKYLKRQYLKQISEETISETKIFTFFEHILDLLFIVIIYDFKRNFLVLSTKFVTPDFVSVSPVFFPIFNFLIFYGTLSFFSILNLELCQIILVIPQCFLFSIH